MKQLFLKFTLNRAPEVHTGEEEKLVYKHQAHKQKKQVLKRAEQFQM